jgi:hypothetical protein
MLLQVALICQAIYFPFGKLCPQLEAFGRFYDELDTSLMSWRILIMGLSALLG